MGQVIKYICARSVILASMLLFVAVLLLGFSFIFKRGRGWLTVAACSMIPGVVMGLVLYYVYHHL